MAQKHRAYNEIPGTYVFDGEHYRKGYALNMMCKTLDIPENREAFDEDEEAYLDKFALTSEQRLAVLERDWLEMLNLGGNIYYTFKIAIFDRVSMQYVGAKMSGMTETEFKRMMLDGGRSEATAGGPGAGADG